MKGSITTSRSGATWVQTHWEFTRIAVASGGSAVAGPLTNSASDVTNGVFTVTLDFANGFTGGLD